MKTARILLALVLLAPAAEAASPAPTRRRSAPLLAQRPPTTRTPTRAPAATPAPAPTPAPEAAPSTAAPSGPVAVPTGSATPNPELSAAQIVAGIQNFYDRTNDYEADFQQVSRTRLSGGQQTRSGHVRFRKPGRMRWDYNQPQGDVIVSDGTTLWAYEAAARQAIQSNLQQSQLPSALSFLTGTGRLADDFTFRRLDSQRMQYPNGYVIELRPVQPNPSFERILFYVEPANFQVVRTAVIDAQGNSNTFTFTHPRVNTNPAPTVFQWSPPAGTQIVRP